MAIEPDIPDTPADPGTIEASATDLRKVAAVLTGHGDDVNAAVNTAALQFSDVVSGPIRTLATKNLAAFQAAFAAVAYGADITHSWSQDVRTFKTERQKLLANWQFDNSVNFGVNQPTIPANASDADRTAANQKYDSQLNSARQTAANDLSLRAYALLNQLRDQANDWAGRIRHTPDDSDLLALARAGGLSWGTYLSLGKQADPKVPPPLTAADGSWAAGVVRRGPDDPDYGKALALLGLLSAYSVQAQKNGDKLTAGELAYLKAFYGNLDKKDLNRAIEASAGNKAQLKALGGGLLALSSEKLGGSYGDLPQYLRDILDKSAVEYGYSTGGTAPVPTLGIPELRTFGNLAAALSQADPSLVGGTQFSENLTLRVSEIASTAQTVHENGKTIGVSNADLYDYDHIKTIAQGLIGVSTRNHDADYAVLTGSDGAYVLGNLTHFDWPDRGAAASGLVNWIAEDGRNPDHGSDTYKHATQAAEVLLHALDDTTANGGSSPFQNFYADFHKNPAFSGSLANIADTYIGDFAEKALANERTGIENDGTLTIRSVDRQHFLALIGADPNALNALSLKAGEYEAHLLQDTVHGKLDSADALRSVSILNGELDATPANVELIDKELKFEHDAKKYGDTQYYLNLGRSSAQFGLGLVGDKGVSSFALGQLVDLFTHNQIAAPDPDLAASFQPPDGQGSGDVRAAHDYAEAWVATHENLLHDSHDPAVKELVKDFVRYDHGKPHLINLSQLNDHTDEARLEQLVRHLGGQRAQAYLDHYDTEWYDAYTRAKGTSGAAILRGDK
ncbi:hypothetical protein [Fodinicola acaciae]|uniref:TPR repeat region-containing protein n=1 Tax=Fodinicola acaciae TaxID=2681555 RepID=UPI0013D3F2A6|nr:hypothetical protein [Fodinicola acaciae]